MNYVEQIKLGLWGSDSDERQVSLQLFDYETKIHVIVESQGKRRAVITVFEPGWCEDAVEALTGLLSYADQILELGGQHAVLPNDRASSRTQRSC